jgi:hypothetical protein
MSATPPHSSAGVYALAERAIDAFADTSFTFRQMFPDWLVAGVLDGSVQLRLRRGVVPRNDLAGAVVSYHPVRLAEHADHRLATSRASASAISPKNGSRCGRRRECRTTAIFC